MRKVVSLMLVVVFVLAFSSVAFAMSSDGLDKSPVFEDPQWDDIYQHQKIDNLWFDTRGDNHRFYVPGNAWKNANLEDSAINTDSTHREVTYLDPKDTD